MKLSMNAGAREMVFDLSRPINISIPVQRADSVSSFMIKGAVYEDYTDGDFIGNKARGGSCNLETITFTAHGNGSHTECVGHIANETYYVNEHVKDSFYSAQLVSLPSKTHGEGLALDFSGLDLNGLKQHDALVIRSLPNESEKLHKDYSGKATPCITTEDMSALVAAGIEHLLVDLPSVDPEWDGGALASHHIFWNYPQNPRTQCSITEFIFIDDSIEDGHYLLKLNIANFISDAAPSTPTLYPLI